MTERDRLARLLDHLEWANARALDSARAQATDGDAVRLLAHLIASEQTWLDRIEGREDLPFAAFWPDWSITQCEAAGRESLRRMRSLLESSGALERVVAYRNSRGQSFENSIGDILTHVALHGAYHRGQVARALRQGGAEPVNTDFITWAREPAGTPPGGGASATG